MPGTTVPGLAPYVVSLNNLYGIITLDGVGAIDVTSSGNTIFLSLSAAAGLGTVTQVAAVVDAGSAAALAIAGSPINTFGTFTFVVDPALVSIAGLTTAADQMIYTTGANVYAATSLTGFGRSLVDDANAAAGRTTLGGTTIGQNYFTLANPGAITFPRQNADNSVSSLTAVLFRTAIGLEIGVNVQAWSADLDSFVTHASWAGNDLTLTGGLTLGENLSVAGTGSFADNVTMALELSVGGPLTASGGIVLGGSNIAGGTWEGDAVGPTFGGTGLSSYTTGDLIYASAANTLSNLAAVAIGSVLISQGVGVAPVWGDASNLAISVPTGNTLWVSKTGDNSPATRGVLNLAYLDIQNAINAASPGDTVVVLPGTYTENIELANGVTLIGLGLPVVSGTIGCVNANTTDVFNMRATQIALDAGALVRFHNCRVDAAATASAVIVDAGVTAYFFSCEFNYTGASAVYALECSGTVRAYGCRIRTTSAAVNAVLVGANNSQLQSCTIISGSAANSLYAAGAQSIGVLGCYANTAKHANVTLSPSAGYTVDANIS